MSASSARAVFAALVAVAVPLSSCSMWTDAVCVRPRAPVLPEQLQDGFDVVSWTLRWLGPSGDVEQASIRFDDPLPPVFLARRRNTPLSMTPLCSDGSEPIPPAGGVYPQDLLADGTMRVSWWAGLSAKILLSLAAAGVPIEAFDAESLSRRIRQAGGGSPWTVDAQRLTTAMMHGELSYHSVARRAAHELMLSGVSGLWLWADPLRQEPLVANATGLSVDGVVAGMHYFVRPSDGARISLFADEAGWAALSTAMEYAECGRW